MIISLQGNNTTNISSVASGDILIFQQCMACQALIKWAADSIASAFGNDFDINEPLELPIDEFVKKASIAKTNFTNDSHTKILLGDLISLRYKELLEKQIYYDVPRLRLIPSSDYLKSGVSYNYKPHRDTWYGASQGQINHWISAINVSKEATFFIAPSYFDKPILNSSCDFDLDVWDSKYRNLASQNIKCESRPHPVPLEGVDQDTFIGFDIPSGSEICFSGHHLHGSLRNATQLIRVSIDYRIEVGSGSMPGPKNIDSLAKGDYQKYMFKYSHSSATHQPLYIPTISTIS